MNLTQLILFYGVVIIFYVMVYVMIIVTCIVVCLTRTPDVLLEAVVCLIRLLDGGR